MSGPLIFIATNRLREGAFDAERARVPGFVDFIERNEPRLIAFNEYVDEERSEVTIVQVHPDARSMENHLGVVRERATEAFEETLVGTTRVEVLGTPSDEMMRSLRAQAGDSFELRIRPLHLGGFTRPVASGDS
jgi:hypothetical protein